MHARDLRARGARAQHAPVTGAALSGPGSAGRCACGACPKYGSVGTIAMSRAHPILLPVTPAFIWRHYDSSARPVVSAASASLACAAIACAGAHGAFYHPRADGRSLSGLENPAQRFYLRRALADRQHTVAGAAETRA